MYHFKKTTTTTTITITTTTTTNTTTTTMEQEYKTKILRGKGTPITPGTIRIYFPADFLEFSIDENELPAPQLGGNLRPHVCDNEEATPKPATSQPSWADFHPELAAKSSGGPVKDTAVVKAYKEDLAIRERASKRKAEEVTEDSLMVLKRKSFFYYFLKS